MLYITWADNNLVLILSTVYKNPLELVERERRISVKTSTNVANTRKPFILKDREYAVVKKLKTL
jgi:hypothetical protein